MALASLESIMILEILNCMLIIESIDIGCPDRNKMFQIDHDVFCVRPMLFF